MQNTIFWFESMIRPSMQKILDSPFAFSMVNFIYSISWHNTILLDKNLMQLIVELILLLLIFFIILVHSGGSGSTRNVVPQSL
jgi:phosphoribulokinase